LKEKEKENEKDNTKKCPICRKELEMKEYHGLERWACPICSYILIMPREKKNA
jgi:DNA-directed RNA polymerase subunit RPC12/RpoP